jgi:integrase
MAIPLAEEAVRILRARRDNQQLGQVKEWVFPSAESATGHVVNPEDPWHRILKAAGIKEYATLHDIRRTLGSRLAKKGVAGATISKVLGHVSSQSLRHYAHLDVNDAREAVDQAFAGIVDRDKN